MTKKNTPAFSLISGAQAITAVITSIARRGVKLDRDIQVAALSAMQHHVEHGDVTLINRLIEAMPKGSRVNALMTYIETFGAVLYDAETKKFVHSRTKTFRIEEAMAVLWTEFKPEQAYQSITDPAGLINMLAKKFEKDIAEMGDKSKVTPDMVQQLRDMTSAEVLH